MKTFHPCGKARKMGHLTQSGAKSGMVKSAGLYDGKQSIRI
jgi:hypothetical protein